MYFWICEGAKGVFVQNHKIGVHVSAQQRNNYGVAASHLVACATFDPGAFDELSPEAIKIFRTHGVKDHKDAPGDFDKLNDEELANAAHHWWPKLRGRFAPIRDRYKENIFFQPINEVNNPRTIIYLRELVKLAEKDGYKLALWGDAGGSPEWDLWVKEWVPFMRDVQAGGHIYSRHAYSGVSEEFGADNRTVYLTNLNSEPTDSNTGRPFKEAKYMRDHGITMPMVITELGWLGGWSNLPHGWLGDLLRYNNLMLQHENIVGCCVWNAGQWETAPNILNGQPLLDLGNQLITMRPMLYDADDRPTVPAEPTGSQPDVEPVADDSWGQPRVQYDRKYYLLHDSMGADWAKGVIDATWGKERATIGASADDAGIGQLDEKTVVIINPELWGDEIGPWFNTHYPKTKIETVTAATADGLAAVMNEPAEPDGPNVEPDVEPNEPLPPTGEDSLFTHWPTNYTYVTQAFGQNPAWYQKYGLPAHNGVDIMAPANSPIMAAMGGRVIYTGPNNSNGSLSAYGYHVRVQSDRLIAIYAHLKPNMAVKAGDTVRGGQILGYSGNSRETSAENSTGPHLHFELRNLDGGLTGWPWGIVDPSDGLKVLYNDPRLSVPYAVGVPGEVSSKPTPTRKSNAALGIHLSADGYNMAGDVEMVQAMRPNMVKALSNHRPEDLSVMARVASGAIWVIRAFLDFYDDGQQRGRNISPAQFVNDTIGDVSRSVGILRAAGVAEAKIYIELHNEPNLITEGFGASWTSGGAFADWFLDVLAQYRQKFPRIQMGFPGVSPGHMGGVRPVNHVDFMRQAASGIRAADWLGVHAYWSNIQPMTTAESHTGIGVVRHAVQYGKPIIVSEASHNLGGNSYTGKAKQYIDFAQLLNEQPKILGVTYFVLSASNPEWGWHAGSAETWTAEMAKLIGKRK